MIGIEPHELRGKRLRKFINCVRSLKRPDGREVRELKPRLKGEREMNGENEDELMEEEKEKRES